jgi:hypothetical protein
MMFLKLTYKIDCNLQLRSKLLNYTCINRINQLSGVDSDIVNMSNVNNLISLADLLKNLVVSFFQWFVIHRRGYYQAYS